MEAIESNPPPSPVVPNSNSSVDFINPQRARSSLDEQENSSLETLEDPSLASCFACFSNIFQSFLDWINSLFERSGPVNPLLANMDQEIDRWKNICISDNDDAQLQLPKKIVMGIAIKLENIKIFEFAHNAYHESRFSCSQNDFPIMDQALTKAKVLLESNPEATVEMIFCILSNRKKTEEGEKTTFDITHRVINSLDDFSSPTIRSRSQDTTYYQRLHAFRIRTIIDLDPASTVNPEGELVKSSFTCMPF